MGAFDAFDIAKSGADVSQLWLNAIAHNIANVNTVRSADEEPFHARLVHAEKVLDDNGVGERTRTVEILESNSDPMLVFDPENPLANDQGYVVRPDVDLSKEMTDMIAAQRSYQLNLQVIRTNEETYQAALRIGR